MRPPFPDLGHPILQGHRGAAGEVPENTLAGFVRAVDAGVDVIETDLHLTADGHVVLIHDPTLDRTTDGRGAVAGIALGALRSLDAGARFSTDGGATFPFAGRGLRVPTLVEALDALPAARFNLELKEGGPALAARTLDVVRDAGRLDRVLFSSFDRGALAWLDAEAARRGLDLSLGLAEEDTRRFVQAAAADERPPAPCAVLQLPVDHEGRTVVTPRLVAYAHRHGVRVYAWTVNDADAMTALLDAGVDGIVTDLPSVLGPPFRERASGPVGRGR